MPPAIWELVELAAFAEKGSLPLAGGAADQLDAFLQGCRVYWNERERIKAEMHDEAIERMKR